MRYLLIIGLLLAPHVKAQDIIIILDEGYNTSQRLDLPSNLRGEQYCISTETNRLVDSNGTSNFVSGSICKDQTTNFQIGNDAAEYQNSRTYSFFSSAGTPNATHQVTLKATIGGLNRGEHGNWVSNAAYDFDRTLGHRLWQVFGILRDGNTDNWVTRFDPDRNPGETIQFALDQIGILDTNPLFESTVQRNLGAVVMSLGAGAGNLSDLKCGAEDGQASVSLLRQRGIAVVVALQNTDIPSNKESWPACLDGVVKVVGESAASYTGLRQAGVGASGGIDFFAKDTTNDNQEGNSFAAPRIAAAYAKLHELFPNSTVDQKTEALNQASTLMDSYRTRLIDGSFQTYRARKIRKTDLASAIQYLSFVVPAQDNSSTDFLLAFNSRYGTLNGGANQPFGVVLDFNNLPSTASSKNTAGALTQKAGTGVLSSRRDVEVKFTGEFGTGIVNEFLLKVNGQIIKRFTGYFGFTPRVESFVINRNIFNENGNNIIRIESLNTNNPWEIRNIQMSFLPSVPLTVGTVNNSLYGYQQNPTRFTGLRATFDLPAGEIERYTLSATGFDIDLANETEVFVNGNFLGNLNVGAGSSQFSTPNQFLLSSTILKNGKNYIEFVQREPQVGVWSGFQNEKWAVKDILVKQVSEASSIVPIIMLLLDD
jgi:hypothetical protein